MIVIENESDLSDQVAMDMVTTVVKMGKMCSGEYPKKFPFKKNLKFYQVLSSTKKSTTYFTIINRD